MNAAPGSDTNLETGARDAVSNRPRLGGFGSATWGIPTTLLLDLEGRERWRKTGPAEWDSPEIIEALRGKLRGDAS